MSETKTLDNVRELPSLREIGQMTARVAGGTVEHFFQSNKKALSDLIADTALRPERLLKIAQGAIRQNPDLQQCTVRSLFGAVVVCASMGLEPNTHEGLCWFIPRKISRPRKNEHSVIMKGQDGKWLWDTTFEVNVQIGYKGRIALAYRNPMVKLLRTTVIYEHDKYRITEGTNPRIDHEPNTRGDRGEPIIYYAIAKLATGEVLFDWKSRADVDRIRDNFSDAYNMANTRRMEAQNILARSGNTAEVIRRAQVQLDRAEDAPWIRDYEQMARKTLINSLSNYLPANRQSALAAALDARDTTLQSQDLDQYTFIDADFDSEANGDTDEEASQELQQLAHQQPGPTVEDLKSKQREPVRTEPQSETQHVQQAKTDAQPKQEVRTEPKAAETKPNANPATDLAGRPTPWFEAPGVKLPTRAMTAAKKGAEFGTVTLEDALAKDAKWWRDLPGVGEAAQAQLEVALNALRPAQQAPKTDAATETLPAPGPADVHEEDTGGFGDAA